MKFIIVSMAALMTACSHGHDAFRSLQSWRAAPNIDGLSTQAVNTVLKLEREGRAPKWADPAVLRLAMRCTWWGRPLEPREFWSDKPMWQGMTVADDAHRQGRLHPPIPFDGLPRGAGGGARETLSRGDLDSEQAVMLYSAEEAAFWSRWGRILPEHPDDIARAQVRHLWHRARSYEEALGLDGVAVKGADRVEIPLPRTYGAYPAEAFSPDAVMGAIVAKRRSEYRRLQSQGITDDVGIKRLMQAGFALPMELVEHDPTADEKARYDAWKYDYLDRLRREGWSEVNIDAYASYWTLDKARLKENPAAEHRSGAPPVPPALWERVTGRKWDW